MIDFSEKDLHWRILLKDIKDLTKKKGKSFCFERDAINLYVSEGLNSEQKKAAKERVMKALQVLVDNKYVKIELGADSSTEAGMAGRIGRVIVFLKDVGVEVKNDRVEDHTDVESTPTFDEKRL